MNKNVTNILIGLVMGILLTTCYFQLGKISDSTQKTISSDLACTQLYELKKEKYWGEKIGQSKAIYNSKLDSCLALNMYSDFDTDEYFATVINMSNDSTLLDYSSKPKGFYFEGDKKNVCQNDYVYFEHLKNNKEVKEYGCTTDNNGNLTDNLYLFDKMLEEVRSYGFKVFDGFESK
jgi:hypothetical protein